MHAAGLVVCLFLNMVCVCLCVYFWGQQYYPNHHQSANFRGVDFGPPTAKREKLVKKKRKAKK